MTLAPRVPVEKALNVKGPISAEDALSIVEIAYLTIASDGRLQAEELEALDRIAEVLFRAAGASYRALRADGAGPTLDQRIDGFAEALDRDGMEARLHTLAGRITDATTQALAYKASVAIALADLATNDREFELDLQLISELGLSQEDAELYADQVREALIVPDEGPEES